MKASKFYIKSNYIKNAKDHWIFCDGKLLYHQNIAFLHLKSTNFDRNSLETINNCSEFSIKIQPSRSRSKEQNIKLNVLCNLMEFKSCEIKSVNFEFVNKFAIKLVPSGFLSSKKLYLLPDLEDSLTEWCGLLTGFITKTLNLPLIDSSMNVASTPKSTISTDIANKEKYTAKDFDISLDDNDAYEVTNQNEFYLASIKPSEDSIKLNLQGNYFLKLGVESLELVNPTTSESIHTFPYSSIRRFGAKDSMFRLEAGRHCSTGTGSFTFQVNEATNISEKLKINAKLFKDRRSVHSSCMTLNRPSILDFSLQVETKRDSSLNSRKINTLDSPFLDRISKVENTKASTIPSMNTENDFHERKSVCVVEEETSPLKTEIYQENKNVTSNNDLLDCEAKNNLYDGTISSSVKLEEKSEVSFKEIAEEKEENIQFRNITSSILRYNEDVNSDSNFINYKSEHFIEEKRDENTKELKTMSLYNISSSGGSLHSSPSLNPLKNGTPPIIGDYKVSDSTFFKYRQLPKPATQILPSLFLKNSTLNSLPTKSDRNSLDIESPKKSPPPLLPKPKLKLTDGIVVQSDYREFDKIVKDLQLP